MFFNLDVLRRFVPKIFEAPVAFINLNRVEFCRPLSKQYLIMSRNKTSEEKRLPDIYVMSDLQTLNTELKIHLPESVNIIKVPIHDSEQNIQILPSALEILTKAEILVTDGSRLAQLLYTLPNAKWVQNTWAGVEGVIKKLDRSKPLPSFTFTRYSDTCFGDSMANYVMAQIINIERRFYIYHDKQKVSYWDKLSNLPDYRGLRDLTVGVLGAGNLGAAVGRHLKNAGSQVIAFVRKARDEPSDSYDVAVTDMQVVLNKCDYICNVLPSTESTRGLLDNDVLQSCKKRPVFINIGRGDIIQNDSLLKALKEGWISGAVLDVFIEEPLPPDNPLWKIPEVHITPHIAAVTTVQGLAKFTSANYLRYVNGESLMNIVDWNIGY